jgi:hypothetical protein
VRKPTDKQSHKSAQSLAVWPVLMPECLPEWLRIEKDGVIEVPLIRKEDIHRFRANRQKKAESQHSIGSQYNSQWPK